MKPAKLWSGFRWIHPLLFGALSGADEIDRPPAPYHGGSPPPSLPEETSVRIALRCIDRVLPILREDELRIAVPALERARAALAGIDEPRGLYATMRRDGTGLADLAEELAFRHLDPHMTRPDVRIPLRRIGTLCTELLRKRGRRSEVRPFCEELDEELMRAEVLAFERMNIPAGVPYEKIRRVTAAGGECAHRTWTWRWFAVELDDAEESDALLLFHGQSLEMKLLRGTRETLLAKVAADSRWSVAAPTIEATLAQRALSRAFFTQFPDRAPILIGAMRMLFGGDSLPCDICRPGELRGPPRSCCGYCKATLDAARDRRRRLSTEMLSAEAARAATACDLDDGPLLALARAMRNAEKKSACVCCGAERVAALVLTAGGPLCRPCVYPFDPREESRDDGR